MEITTVWVSEKTAEIPTNRLYRILVRQMLKSNPRKHTVSGTPNFPSFSATSLIFCLRWPELLACQSLNAFEATIARIYGLKVFAGKRLGVPMPEGVEVPETCPSSVKGSFRIDKFGDHIVLW